MDKCGEISVMWRNFSTLEMSQFVLYCRENCFVAIFAVLSRKLLNCDLGAFAWKKIEPNIVPVEKRAKYYLSGMVPTVSKVWQV